MTAHEAMNTRTATAAARAAIEGSTGRNKLAVVNTGCIPRKRPAVLRGPGGSEHREGDEGEEPGQVEVEPVRERQLEADQHCGRERRELKDGLAPRHEEDRDRADDERD